MKTIYAFITLLLLATGASAQNTGILQITLDTKQMSGTCNLSAADTVYIHSGVGWSNADSVWESIVGNWGLDNGKGEMVNLGNGVWSICFNVQDYYHNFATQDSTNPNGEGYGPMPLGATAYNIGAVFRKASCTYSTTTHRLECTPAETGKDENCQNVYILRIDQPLADSTIDPNNILDNSGNQYPAISARYITTCAGYSATAVNDLNPSFTNIITYPVPFSKSMRVEFQNTDGEKPVMQIFNQLGQKVADFSSMVHKGFNSLQWNGNDMSGSLVPAGMYLLQITNGNQTYSGKLIKQ